ATSPPGGSARRAAATASVRRRSAISSSRRRLRATRYSGDSPGNMGEVMSGGSPFGFEMRGVDLVAPEQWPAFRERAEEAGGLPRFIEREVEEFLRCGVLGWGCLHTICWCW